jgi:hypothetical protein
MESATTSAKRLLEINFELKQEHVAAGRDCVCLQPTGLGKSVDLLDAAPFVRRPNAFRHCCFTTRKEENTFIDFKDKQLQTLRVL